jgi:hypothetical protein
LRSVLRSTPRLAASSCCERPAYQWVKISTISITSKVLLGTVGSTSLLGNEPGAFGLSEAKPDSDTHVLPRAEP